MKYLLQIIAILGLVGCASGGKTYLIEESPDGGRVQAIGEGSEAASEAKAASVMAKKCPDGYERLKWGFENTGATAPLYGAMIPIKAYFVEFKCKSAARGVSASQ